MTDNHKKIAKNTIILYLRMLFIALLSFYTVRIVLDALGVEDYGIYNVVAGIVALSSFIPSALSSATQRFFSFALGEKNQNKLEQIFSTNLIIYFTITIVSVLLLETIGFYFVKEYLKIPLEKMEVAFMLYHLSVFTFAFSIFSSPFMAIIISHEDMNIYAIISIIEAILKLAVAFFLVSLPFENLLSYGLLMMIVSFLIMAFYISISFKKYKECHIKKLELDKKLLKEILDFTAWTIFGSFTTIIRTHGVTILLNQMFNPTVVAARAVAVQIVGFTNIFAQNFNTALYPPIIKSYASDDKEEMYSLVYNGSKLTFFLMWIILLPIIFKIEFLVDFWLKNPPVDVYLFAQLALIESIIFAISMPLTTAARAPGKMKLYELTLGAMQLFILPVSWIVLNLGYEAYWVFIVAIIANVLMFFTRLYLVSLLTGLNVLNFLEKVFVPIFIVVFFSLCLSYYLNNFFGKSFIDSILFGLICFTTTLVIIYIFGIDKDLKIKIKNIIYKKLERKNKI